MINIVLTDDHQVVRQGLKALLTGEPDLKVVGETGDSLEAVKLVESLRPDVIILDILMEGVNGLEVARQLCKRCPKTSVVIFSMHSNEAYVLEALRAGVKAYVLKESPSSELIHAIREVMDGRRFLSSSLSERAIEVYTQQTQTTTLDPYESLSTREREILHLAAQGHTSAEIAKKLFISPRTAETHRTNLMRKLGLHSQSQLIHYAVQRKLIQQI